GIGLGAGGIGAHHRRDLAVIGPDGADDMLARDRAGADQPPAQRLAHDLCLLAAPQLARMMRWTSPTKSTGRLSPWIIRRIWWAPRSPSAWLSTATVVRGGCVWRASRTSSKPTRAKSR